MQVDKFYLGETDNIELRLSKHNQHSYSGSFTKIADDWKLEFSLECSSRNQALLLEKFIKKMKSRIFIRNIIANPEILKDIISKNDF